MHVYGKYKESLIVVVAESKAVSVIMSNSLIFVIANKLEYCLLQS